MNNVNIRGRLTLMNQAGDVVFEDHNLVVYGGYDAIASIVGAAAGDETPEGSFQVKLFSGGSNTFARTDTAISGTVQASAGISSYSLDTAAHSVILNYEVSASSFNGTTTLTTAGLYWNGELFSEVDLDDLVHEANTAYAGTWEIIFGDDTIPVGEGTSSDPYLIANATQLNWFMSQVNGGSTSIHGALIANITYNQGKDVAGYDGKSSNTFTAFTPICTSSGGYKGTFDGRGNTISGIYINTADYTRAGLFGYIGSGGIVKDVIMTNYYIASSYVGSSEVDVGSIAGQCMSGGTITGCSCNGTVDVTSDCTGSEVDTTLRCGGIAGTNSGTCSSNTMSGSVDVSGTATTYIYCGGIAGNNNYGGTCSSNTMSGSVDVSGTATTYIYCGGIAGNNYGGTCSSNTMSGSVDVSGTATTYIYCGGIAGNNNYGGGTIKGNYAYGTVDVSGTAGSYIRCGGIVGHLNNMASGSVATIAENYMYGSVDVSGTAATNITCGGIVGYRWQDTDCYVYENSLYGSYTCTGSYGGTLYLGAIVAEGQKSDSDYLYDNYDYSSDSVSAMALTAASVSVASVEATDEADTDTASTDEAATEVVTE